MRLWLDPPTATICLCTPSEPSSSQLCHVHRTTPDRSIGQAVEGQSVIRRYPGHPTALHNTKRHAPKHDEPLSTVSQPPTFDFRPAGLPAGRRAVGAPLRYDWFSSLPPVATSRSTTNPGCWSGNHPCSSRCRGKLCLLLALLLCNPFFDELDKITLHRGPFQSAKSLVLVPQIIRQL